MITGFQLKAPFKPAGDQPKAIKAIKSNFKKGKKQQILLGVTGSGKTLTMAHVIAQMNEPALILAPNKTLAAQLFGEFKELFRKTPWSILSVIMTTTNRKLIFPPPTPI